jgi:hypothetical protein
LACLRPIRRSGGGGQRRCHVSLFRS